MSLKSNFISFFIFLVLFFNLFVAYSVFVSYKFQYLFLSEFNNGQFSKATYNKIKQTDFYFPNISVTALPLKSVKGYYHYLYENYSEALQELNKSVNDSPYLMFNESIKAKVFIKTQVKDSALFYAEKAFFNLPNNINYFQDLMLIYSSNNDYESAYNAIKKVSLADQLNMFFDIYLSSLYIMDTDFPEYILDHVRNIYPSLSDNNLLSLADNILYGKDNILKSQEAINSANSFFDDGNYINAADLYNKSYLLNPNQFSSYENEALCYINLNKFSQAVEVLLKLKNLNPLKFSLKSNYLLGLSYANLNSSSLACEYLKIAYEGNYRESFPLYFRNCK